MTNSTAILGSTGSIGTQAIEVAQMHGIRVTALAANTRVDELVKHAIHVAKYQEKPLRQDFCGSADHGGAVHRCLHAVSHLIEDHAERTGVPADFASAKLIEGDAQIAERLELDENEKEMLEHIVLQMEKERGLDASAAIADMRFDYIERVCDACLIRPRESREHARSRKIDRVLTGKFSAIPLFIAIMGLVFFLTFFLIGPWLQDLLASGIGSLQDLASSGMEAAHVNETIRKLVTEGIFEGVGSVISFLPLIVLLFLFLSLLEDSGYIARVAFVMDKMLRKIGLSGRSIVPMLIGFGCTVPAVMSTRTLPSDRDRKMTILLTPFMSCTAKLPIYSFFVTAFFPQTAWLIITGLYLLGILTGILVALLYRKTLFRGNAVPFVMELPNYRIPSPRNVLQLLWEKAKDFLQRAFTVILVATIIVWFLKSFTFNLNLTPPDADDSILAVISSVLVPVFVPLGLGDWRLVTSLISGFMAKESVVSITQMLFTAGAGITAAISPLTAVCMLVFCLLYTPCVAAIAAIRREMGRRWAWFTVFWQCAIAWIAALIVRLIGMLLGAG